MFVDNSLKSIVDSINGELCSDYTTSEILDNTTFIITLYTYNCNIYECTCILEGITFAFNCFWYKDNTISYDNLKIKDSVRVRCYC